MENSIVGIEKHETKDIDDVYTEKELAVLKHLGLNVKDIKSKK